MNLLPQMKNSRIILFLTIVALTMGTIAYVELLPILGTQLSISIVSYYSYTDKLGYIHIFGEVENKDDSAVRNVLIQAKFFDKNMNVLGTSSAPTELDVLLPDEKSPFEIISLNQEIDLYELKIADYVTTSEKPYRDFEISSTRLSNDVESICIASLNVHGEIRNTGSTTVSNVKIVATFYDRAGEVVATAATTLRNQVNKGETTQFKVYVLHEYVLLLIDHYSLTAQGIPVD